MAMVSGVLPVLPTSLPELNARQGSLGPPPNQADRCTLHLIVAVRPPHRHLRPTRHPRTRASRLSLPLPEVRMLLPLFLPLVIHCAPATMALGGRGIWEGAGSTP